MLLELSKNKRGYFIDLTSFKVFSKKNGKLEEIKEYVTKGGKKYYFLFIGKEKVRFTLFEIFKENIKRIQDRVLEA